MHIIRRLPVAIAAVALCACGTPAAELECGANAIQNDATCDCVGDSIPNGDGLSCDPCASGEEVNSSGDACQWRTGLKAACTDDASCPLGHCEQGLVEKFCTYACSADTECPENWGCNSNGVCGLPDDFRKTCDPNQADSNADCPSDNMVCVAATNQCNPLAFPGFATVCQGHDPLTCPADTICAQEGTELFYCAEPARLGIVEPLPGATTTATPTFTWEDPIPLGLPAGHSMLLIVTEPTTAGIPPVFGIVPPTVTSVTVGSYPTEWIDLAFATSSGQAQTVDALPAGPHFWAARARPCPFDLSDGGAATVQCVAGFFSAPSEWWGGAQSFTVE